MIIFEIMTESGLFKKVNIEDCIRIEKSTEFICPVTDEKTLRWKGAAAVARIDIGIILLSGLIGAIIFGINGHLTQDFGSWYANMIVGFGVGILFVLICHLVFVAYAIVGFFMPLIISHGDLYSSILEVLSLDTNLAAEVIFAYYAIAGLVLHAIFITMVLVFSFKALKGLYLARKE